MSKTSFVLQALKILGLEEMLKLSQVLHVKQVPLKKAAGEELIVWDEAPEKPAKKLSTGPEPEENVLPFPKKSINDLAPAYTPESEEEEGEKDHLLSSELVLWQREINRQASDDIHKKEAFKGYRKSTEMYVVKTSTVEGKDKIRFAATDGVLINKKQA